MSRFCKNIKSKEVDLVETISDASLESSHWLSLGCQCQSRRVYCSVSEVWFAHSLTIALTVRLWLTVRAIATAIATATALSHRNTNRLRLCLYFYTFLHHFWSVYSIEIFQYFSEDLWKRLSNVSHFIYKYFHLLLNTNKMVFNWPIDCCEHHWNAYYFNLIE